MTKFYPLFLNLNKRNCVVIGAGEVAARKVERLIECGARVTLVGRSVTPELAGMRDDSLLRHIDDDYRSDHLADAFLVIAATDDEEVNRRVHADAEAGGLLVNIVDRPELCNFIVPALARRGDLTVAVSTSGRSPAMARRIRDELESSLDEGYGPLLVIMGELRRRILARGKSSDENRPLFESLADSPLLRFIREKQWDEAQGLILEHTGERITLPDFLNTEMSFGGDD